MHFLNDLLRSQLMNGVDKLTFNFLSLRAKRSNLFLVQSFFRLLRHFVPRNDNVIGFSPIIILILLIPLIMISCDEKGEKVTTGGRKLKVVTTLFPLYDFAKNIGKEKADVILLLPPGVEPHAFEPRPGDILKIHKADIFIYTGRFMEPWVEDILKSIGSQGPLVIDSSKVIKLSEETGENEGKHECWLDYRLQLPVLDNGHCCSEERDDGTPCR